ncbi:hypothetical protein BZG36_03824 [Bifiguratus adelaidae]|uniref:Protein phosphatase n=1 Tax=Bifiguratus adelaidae TaxID=1938954 RepID=A0A261XZN5_9FUNG|nr:hypothetical protein BZG36_03824 [Bifiguratus adelaidae]
MTLPLVGRNEVKAAAILPGAGRSGRSISTTLNNHTASAADPIPSATTSVYTTATEPNHSTDKNPSPVRHSLPLLQNPVPYFQPVTTFQHQPHYILSHATAAYPKPRRESASVPSPPLTPTRHYSSFDNGEDAWFERYDAVGIADGVGGWKGVKGANSALYSRKLMHQCYEELEKYDNIEDDRFYEYNEADPVMILQRSYEQSSQEAREEGILGSTTAIIAILRKDELRIANLGDCGLSIIRNHEYIFRTEEQQHSFNFPYQLGPNSQDEPGSAEKFTIKLHKNDIIVVGSDGLFDNLFDEDILDEVNEQLATVNLDRRHNAKLDPKVVAEALALRARSVAEDTRAPSSPFQSRAVQEGFHYQGGKSDDISVIVAVVSDSEDTPDRRL